MNRLLFTLLGCLMSCLVWAQTITYTGLVREAESKEPVGYVSVTANGSNSSTLTNTDGRFQITVPEQTQTLTFTHLSFDTQQVNVSVNQTKDLVITLATSDYELEEMVIYNRSIKDVIKEVIKNSQDKFSKDIMLKTYYREMLTINNEVNTFGDGMLDYYYKNKSSSDVVVNQSRFVKFKSDAFKGYESAPLKLYLLNLQEIITNAFQFKQLLKIINNKEYELYVTNKKGANGKTLSTLYFEPSPQAKTALLKGQMVFDESDKLVLEITFDFSQKHLQNSKLEDRTFFRAKFNVYSGKQIFNYVDGRYFLAYDMRRLHAMIESGASHRFLAGGNYELIIIDSDTQSTLPDPDKIYHQNTLELLGKNFKDRYWENQNTLLLTAKEEKILGKINAD